MSRPIRIDLKLVARARRTVETTGDLDDFRSALAVLLPAKVGLTLEMTAEMLGVGTATINRMQSRLRLGRTTSTGQRNWGGRRQSLLTPDEETEFLKPWAEQAQHAGLLVRPRNFLSVISAGIKSWVGWRRLC